MVSEALQAYFDGPASRPPDGSSVNLDGPKHHGTGSLVLLVICLVLTLLACVGRAYSRIFVVKRLRIEDYLGFLALAAYIGNVYAYLRYWVNIGFYNHLWNLKGIDLVEISYVGFIINIAYFLAMLFSKSAILLEWVHIFVPKGTRNTFWWSSRTMMVANIGLYGSGGIVTFVGCQPLERFWNFWLPGYCVDRKARDAANAAFNVLMDIIILFLPQLVIWKLHMTSTRKLGICVVFSIGLLAIATAAGRLHGIVVMDYPSDVTRVFDTSYQFAIELEWIIAELTCVMLVFCVPALPKIISERTVSFASRFTNMWRSWTRLGRSSRSESKGNDRAWNMNEFSGCKIGDIPGSRQRITDEELLITNEEEQTNVLNLAEMRDRYTMSHEIGGQKHSHEHTDPGIVKTVEFDRYDQSISGLSTDVHHKPPPVWTKK